MDAPSSLLPPAASIVPSRITHLGSQEIGRGGFGIVFKARYDGEPVAIKRTRASTAVFDKAVQDEVSMLSKLSHPRIVRFYGVLIDDDGSLAMVLEYMTDGSLYDFYRSTGDSQPSSDEKITWALDIAFGLQYLHELQPPIIHRDLKSPNILMSVEKGSLCAKVSDFGSAIMHMSRTSQISSLAQNLAGTTRYYQAPELNAIKVKFTTSTDMYAFGIILSEIISWEGLFGCSKENMNHAWIEGFIAQGKPIPFDLEEFDVPDAFKNLSTKCAGTKDNRPSVQEAIATLKLGMQQLMGTEGVEKNNEAAIKWFRMAAAQGHAAAQNSLGDRYYHGQGVEQDYQQAVEWYMKSADNGSADAKNNLGFCYKNGHGVEQNNKSAFKWYTESANQGNALAQCNLGFCYQNGHGVSKDYKAAFNWYTKSAEQGDANGQCSLGVCYQNGHGVEQNFKEAMKWYTKAAEQGNSYSQFYLGFIYYEGLGVEADFKTAAKWYIKSAGQGNADAQERYGKGVDRDDKEAFRLYTESALQGKKWSQFYLGASYENGEGVEVDYDMAEKWFTQAAENGLSLAKARLAKLKKRTSKIKAERFVVLGFSTREGRV
ncbi:hypothetical protein HDU97_002257 [Phlyctochytrium planicorne]|nr:hypothetical protein HDU97_002257 [Phlyctochytrium planicorne]